jgi:hypothetical protein
MARARHGMCELMRHGMAGERHGRGMACELALKASRRNISKYVHFCLNNVLPEGETETVITNTV